MLGKEMGYEISTCEMQYDANNKEMDQTVPWFIYHVYTIESGNIARPFMLCTLHSEPV